MTRLWRWLGRTWKALLLWELSAVAWAILASYFTLGRRGHLDWTHHAIGRDFINSWTAGHLVLSGQVNDVFNPPLFLAHERALFDPRLPFHFWSYPPPNLFLVLPLGFTPYMAGLVLWSLAGLVALGFALRAWTRDPWTWAMLMLAPAEAVNIGLGQNGAFTAALLIGGLSVIDRRPALAGALLGLLIFKPQIAVLLPVAVLAGRRWRTMWAAAAMVVAVLGVSLLAFGPAPWAGFFGPTLTTQGLMLRQGHGPFMWMMPSAYMSARTFHLPMVQALEAQAPFTALAAAITGWAWWRRDRPLELRAAILMLATFVASPQAFNYDLIPAAVAALVLLRRDRLVFVGPPLAMLVWAAPVAMMGLEWLHAPITPLVLAAALVRLAMLANAGRPQPLAATPSAA
ncbi:glycosyltransferase family 87 protein [Caulobacter sp. S45]|uniref:glycosyltransferase family 87 protein n=1 Tax=Caulobacter sp. S45 TaxID=1641861 RepID=UPI0015777C2C|nr:glycosyltransferase family 87 protein [Caulobacter sp. S45]